MILDEIHLLGADRGPILEVLFTKFCNLCVRVYHVIEPQSALCQ